MFFTSQSNTPASTVTRRLTAMHVIGLTAIAAAAIISTWLVRAELTRQEIETEVIASANRQAAIGSEIGAIAGAMGMQSGLALDLKDELGNLRSEFGALQLVLDATDNDVISSPTSPVQPAFVGLVLSAERILDGDTSPEQLDDLGRRAELFRSYMELTTAEFADTTRVRVKDLKRVQLSLLQLTLLLLVIEGLVLFRPAAKRIRAGLAAQQERHEQERDKDQQRLTYLSQFDPLTGLANRALLHDRLAQALERAKRDDDMVAVILIDLDQFSLVNERLGQDRGDDLLKLTAQRIDGSIRSSDTTARSGGNEFTVVVEGITSTQHAGRIAEKILDSIAQPITGKGQAPSLTATAGIAVYPEDGDGVDDLLQGADLAMYTAKSLGGGNYRYFTHELRARTSSRLRLIDALRVAVDARTPFQLVYQPKIRIDDQQILGVEALIRWKDSKLGDVPPARFIPHAEETGLIIPLGDWVLEEACQQAKAWHDASHDLSVAVNIAARQFRAPDLLGTVSGVLERTGLPPHLLELELTESTLVDDVVKARRTLHDIRKLGVKVSIDDFGTGYSSLSYLKGLPLDALKIDRSFIKDAISQPEDAAIVNAIIQIAHSLKLKVIAEGVETTEQLELVATMGCDSFQGYLLSKPVPPEVVPGVVSGSLPPLRAVS